MTGNYHANRTIEANCPACNNTCRHTKVKIKAGAKPGEYWECASCGRLGSLQEIATHALRIEGKIRK